MVEEFFDDFVEDEEERPRDLKVDEAKAHILETLFAMKPKEVYYQRQVEVRLEGKYFHWITGKALNELAEEGRVRSVERELRTKVPIRFYWSTTNRYSLRRIKGIEKLVRRFSNSDFTRALGRHGETMFDAALPHGGFLPAGKNVRAYGGKAWIKTGHDLDRVFTREGEAYGVEIKNTLPYIPRDEMLIKMDMCEHLGLVPVFIVRAAPKSYIEEVRKRGGFTLVFAYQLYPHGHAELAGEVRRELGLTVDSPQAIADGTVRRLSKWHEKRMSEKWLET